MTTWRPSDRPGADLEYGYSGQSNRAQMVRLVWSPSIPVALLANTIRITVTGILHDTVGGHAADTFYHDLAGWLMIPLALALYWLEIWVLSRLLIETKRVAVPALELVRSRGRGSVAAADRYNPSVL